MSLTPAEHALSQLLADYYPDQGSARRLVDAGGIPPRHVAFQPRAVDTWYDAVLQAKHRGRVEALVRAAIQDHPGEPLLTRALDGSLEPAVGSDAMDQVGGDVPDAALIQAEIMIEQQSLLLPVSFLARGMMATRPVALIRTVAGVGTGFLIADNLLVTNSHVLPDDDAATHATAVLGYELELNGSPRTGTVVGLRPSRYFRTSEQAAHDCTIVAVDGDVNEDFGAIPVQRAGGGDIGFVSIVQHPYGGRKQVALHHNAVVDHDGRLVHYLTTTGSGSSGAPVFDRSWRLVALHRGHVEDRGIWRTRKRRHNVGTHVNMIVDLLR